MSDSSSRSSCTLTPSGCSSVRCSSNQVSKCNYGAMSDGRQITLLLVRWSVRVD